MRLGTAKTEWEFHIVKHKFVPACFKEVGIETEMLTTAIRIKKSFFNSRHMIRKNNSHDCLQHSFPDHNLFY
jgi:hypothetical protein